MKNDNPKISANEINRYCYCPYQWYYKRYYGTTELNKRYKELGIDTSSHLSHFEKGRLFHKRYYRAYRIQTFIRILLIIAIVIFILWMVGSWIISHN